MQAIRVHQFGGPDVLRLEEAPDPQPGAGHVVVGVHATGVNPVETYIRAGGYAIKPPLPYTPGTDAAGVVEAVGDGVTTARVGERVYIYGTLSGAYAERALCKGTQVYPLPDHISFAQGAAIGVPYATAYRALLQKAGAQLGETVLVHGASGGVGIAAVQIAKAHGLTVIGTAGTPRGLKLLEEQGVGYVLDHHDPGYVSDALGATCGRGVDIVLEMLANVNLSKDLSLLAPRGRIVIIGSRGEATIDPRQAMSRDAIIYGMVLFNTPPDEMAQIHAALGTGLRDGTLQPVVGQEIPLAEAARAHQAVMEPGAYGKIVLVP